MDEFKKFKAPDGRVRKYKLQQGFLTNSDAFHYCESLKQGDEYLDVKMPIHSTIEGIWAVYAPKKPATAKARERR